MTLKTKPFEFTNEFTPTGEFLSGDKPSFKRTETVEQETAQARAEGEAAAMATIEARIATALEQILAQLTPVEQVVTEIASDLRNDAIDLALAASRTIAGKALEDFGADMAREAITQAASQLRDAPEILIIAAPEVAQGAALRLENSASPPAKVRFHADPVAKPGDWRIEFPQGAVAHDREKIEKAVENALEQRKNDPVESQLDLFGGAQSA